MGNYLFPNYIRGEKSLEICGQSWAEYSYGDWHPFKIANIHITNKENSFYKRSSYKSCIYTLHNNQVSSLFLE
jgi:hypothetical protein